MRTIYDLSLDELIAYCQSLDYKPFKAKQIYEWLYRKEVLSFKDMHNLNKELILKLEEDFVIDPLFKKREQISSDGTVKFLFELEDKAYIETVLMAFDYGYSVCISTQVGCNMGCTFCASGLLKKQRDLSSGEIIAQIMACKRYLNGIGARLSNIVVMGTGEPFDNYDEVMKALYIINDPKAIEIGARHISISTCGLVEGIKRFAKEEKPFNLAISLHAPNDELRSKLMPINRAYPLKELFKALKEYSLNHNRRLTFEYLLLEGVNDSCKEADELKELLSGLNAYVNLIPYNEVKENSYRTSSDMRALKFYDMLKKRGVAVTLRQKKGVDIDAACGQLRANEYKRED